MSLYERKRRRIPLLVAFSAADWYNLTIVAAAQLPLALRSRLLSKKHSALARPLKRVGKIAATEAIGFSIRVANAAID